MSKLLAIVVIMSFLFFNNSFEVIEDPTFVNQLQVQDKILPNPPLNSKDQTQKGVSVTDDMVLFYKKCAELAYSFFRHDMSTSVSLIQQQLNNTYPGTWFVCIISSDTNGTTAIPGVDFALSTNSMNGKWWFYGRNFNHYWPAASYFIAKLSDGSFQYNVRQIYSYYNDHSNFNQFKNIVDNVERNTSDVLKQSDKIRQAYQATNKNYFVNLIVSNRTDYVCSQIGEKLPVYADNLNQTTKNKYYVGALNLRR